jgi:hypothetical protein
MNNNAEAKAKRKKSKSLATALRGHYGKTMAELPTELYRWVERELAGLAWAALPQSAVAFAIVGNSARGTEGSWQYSLDQGTTWIDVPTSGLSDTCAIVLRLPVNLNLRFIVVPNWFGTPGELTARVLDGTSEVPSPGAQDISAESFGAGKWLPGAIRIGVGAGEAVAITESTLTAGSLWDRIDGDQRRAWAKQRDGRNHPSSIGQDAFESGFREGSLERKTSEWQSIATPTPQGAVPKEGTPNNDEPDRPNWLVSAPQELITHYDKTGNKDVLVRLLSDPRMSEAWRQIGKRIAEKKLDTEEEYQRLFGIICWAFGHSNQDARFAEERQRTGKVSPLEAQRTRYREIAASVKKLADQIDADGALDFFGDATFPYADMTLENMTFRELLLAYERKVRELADSIPRRRVTEEYASNQFISVVGQHCDRFGGQMDEAVAAIATVTLNRGPAKQGRGRELTASDVNRARSMERSKKMRSILAPTN